MNPLRRRPGEPLRVTFIVPPGRFPTVVHDPGAWWGAIAADPRFDLRYLHTNVAWWETVCASWAPAAGALAALRRPETYATAAAYIDAVAPIVEHVAAMNVQLPDLDISLGRGPVVRGLEYASSAALNAYAHKQTRLSRSIEAALEPLWEDGPGDVLLLVVTSPHDLLAALVIAFLARSRAPAIHVSLVDHGYENFSLAPHLGRLRTSTTLDDTFTTIVESKDERDEVVLALLDAVHAGSRPFGFLRAGQLPARSANAPRSLAPPPPPAVFAATPVLWTRVSGRRCYWGRCAFCVQNVKLDDPKVPSTAEVPAAIERLAAQRDAGYDVFYLSDEALSPHLLRVLSEGILARKLSLRWACRCKVETTYTAELARLVAAAGCYEILFGIETVSSRLLKLMDKYVEAMTPSRTADMLHTLNDAGVGLHLNLLAGFPGATVSETLTDVDWTVRTARTLRSTTYTLNPFVLFPATPIFERAHEFGVVPHTGDYDMPASYPYRVAEPLLAEHVAVRRLAPLLQQRLAADLGWQRFGSSRGAQAAVELYHGSGHGCVMKSRPDNPFAEPLAHA